MARRGSRGGKGRQAAPAAGATAKSMTTPPPDASTGSRKHNGVPGTEAARECWPKMLKGALLHRNGSDAGKTKRGGVNRSASSASSSASSFLYRAAPLPPPEGPCCATTPSMEVSEATGTGLPPPPAYTHSASCKSPKYNRRHHGRGEPLGSSVVSPPLPLPAWAPGLPALSAPCCYTFSEEGLSRELMDFSAYVALTPAEHEQRAVLIHTVAACAADLWPTPAEEEVSKHAADVERTEAAAACATGDVMQPMLAGRWPPRRRAVVTRDLVIYGSYALGLSLPNSDVDMCVALGLPAPRPPPSCLQQTSAPTSGRSPQENPSVICAAKHQPTSTSSRAGSCGSTASTATSCSAATSACSGLVRQRQQLEALYDLADHLLLCHGGWLRLEVHDQCRVPVIKLHDCRTGVSADVSVSVRIPLEEEAEGASEPVPDANDGSQRPTSCRRFHRLPIEDAVRRQREWLRPAEASSPPVSPAPAPTCASCSASAPRVSSSQVFTAVATMLILVTKAALRQWGLNNLFTGGVSSTALYSLVHRYLHTKNSTAAQRPITAVCVPASSVATVHSSTAAASASAADTAEDECCESVCSPTTSHVQGISEDDVEHTGGDGSGSSVVTRGEDSGSGRLTGASTPVPTDDEGGAAGACGEGHHVSHVENLSLPPPPAPLDPNAPLPAIPPHDHLFRQLAEGCVAQFGVSPARLLLNFWRFLSADVFLFGYEVTDAFATDKTGGGNPCGKPDEGASATASTLSPASTAASALSPPADSSPILYDLTAPSFRLPELLALFRCTCTNLENNVFSTMQMPVAAAAMLSRGGGGRRGSQAASPLSLALVDPRCLSSGNQ